MSAKSRLDVLLMERGLAQSRQQAQGLIMAGQVRVAGQVVDKVGSQVTTDAVITVAQAPQFVSRGGDKLASVAKDLGLNFENRLVLDVGSSTGGFSDYALQHGAIKVIAVDVGSGQLAWRLRRDPRVELHEQTDVRDFQIEQLADWALVDVSFVSLLKVLPAVAEMIKPSGQIVALIKPQFEAGKALADKFHGVITDEAVRQEILNQVRAQLERDFVIQAEADSGVLGPKGNRERFVALTKR